MLGTVRKTTRTDVGLALASAGMAYLAWTIVTGVARHVVNELDASGEIVLTVRIVVAGHRRHSRTPKGCRPCYGLTVDCPFLARL